MKEELIQDQGHIVELDSGVFDLSNSTAIITTAKTICTPLMVDPVLANMVGLYNGGNANTKGVNTRKIFPIPYSLARV